MSAELVSILLSFQSNDPGLESSLDYHTTVRKFIQTIKHVDKQHFLKGADTSNDLLELLDPSVNSIAYLYALLARVGAAGPQPTSPSGIPETLQPGGLLWHKICFFLEIADPIQLRYVGEEWRSIVTYVEKVARVMAQPALAIVPIRNALLRLDPSTGTFTLTHLHFIRLCVETKAYAAAMPILDNYIHSLPTDLPQKVANLEYSVPAADHLSSGEYIQLRSGHTGKATVGNIQEYYILGAQAYIGTDQYKKARNFLEHVLVSPTTNGAANGFLLEAYKKWVLVSLLVEGAAHSLPRTANQGSMKPVRAAAKAYEALAEAFRLDQIAKLKAQIAAGRDTWAEDGNKGLVDQLENSLYRHYISGLAKIYSAIPVSKITKKLGGNIQDTVSYVDTLIKEGHLNAQLEDSGNADIGVVLRFFLDPTQGPQAKTEKQQERALLEQTQRTKRLAEQVRSADFRLGLTKEFVENVKREVQKAATTGEAMDTSWDDGMDEDIMGEQA